MRRLWEDYRLHLGLPLTLSLTIWKANAKICNTFAFKFWTFYPVFHSHFKNINVFEIGPKLCCYRIFFNGTIFLEEEFLWNVKRLRELFRVHLDLSLTMWAEFGIPLTLWELFPLHLDLPRLCRSQSAHNLLTICKNSKYVRVRIFSQILEILLIHSIQFFILISKI